jgi:nitroimidazol reductase NimA-like FMN-containing flavoprotein (pyridoxamine 5'-phosphate oxidase superfamily)
MNDERDFAAQGRVIIDANVYMVLGTADREGRPWVTPVYYAPASYREFLWVSKPGARHSRNLEERAEVSIVVFDPTVPIGTGQGVYMSATAGELAGDGRAEALEVYSRRTLSHGGSEWTAEDMQAPARLRLYRAVAVDQYVLDEHDERVPVSL